MALGGGGGGGGAVDVSAARLLRHAQHRITPKSMNKLALAMPRLSSGASITNEARTGDSGVGGGGAGGVCGGSSGGGDRGDRGD